MLLRLRPDTVRRVLLRKTQTSTPLTKGSPTVDIPQENYHPCYSGLQVQDTANSPAVRKFYDKVILYQYNPAIAVCQTVFLLLFLLYDNSFPTAASAVFPVSPLREVP